MSYNPNVNSAVQTGMIVPHAGSSSPSGYLLCDGSAVSRATYATLFATISTIYGSGDGSTTFNLPDLRGRTAVGKDDMGGSAANRITSGGSGITGTTLGAAGGTETHTLTTPQMPSHTHTQDAHNHTQNAHGHAVNSQETLSSGGASDRYSPNSSVYQTATNANAANATNYRAMDATATNIAATATNQNTGGGGAHQNTQPSVILNYVIKT